MAFGSQYVSQIPDFRDLPPNQLDTFIAQHLQPDEQFHRLVSGAMDTLCRYLETKLKPNIKRMVKSGSMGRGTALKNSSDLDCILIMNTIADAKQLRANILFILAQIQDLLAGQPLMQRGWVLKIIKVDEYLLQFEMTNNLSRKSIKVDLLPTFDANVNNGQARVNLYKNVMPKLDKLTRSYCSAALAELQRDFVIERPAKLKGLIRLVKHWAKTCLPSSTSTRRMPSSFLIELVTIHFWEQHASPSSFNTAALFKVIMVRFCNHANLNISWDRYYTLIQAPRPPTILDPANPHSNLYDLVTDWPKVAQVARETLQKRAMQL